MSVNDRNRLSYERIARVYAGDAPGEDDPELRERCRSLFASRLRGPRVLEVGCGPAFDAERLRLRGLDVTATDFAEEFVRIARERYPLLRVERADMTALPYAPASFDGLYGFASFLHLPRALAPPTLAGFARVLVPGGVLFLSLASSTRHAEYVIENWGGADANPMLFTCWSEHAIAAELDEAGFGEVELHRFGSPVYESMPRLVERGVTLFQVIARKR